MCTHFNIENIICLYNLLVIQIVYTLKGLAATHVELEQMLVATINVWTLVSSADYCTSVAEVSIGVMAHYV
jgi:hypothetical protein